MKFLITFILMLFANINLFAQIEWVYKSPLPTINTLRDVCFTTSQKGWMVGEKGTIVATVDGGENWEVQYKKESMQFKCVFFIDDNEGWTVGWHDVLHTTDGGDTWESQYLVGSLDVEAITFINPDTGWIAGSYGLIYRTYDGGENWSIIAGGDTDDPWLEDVYFSDALHGVVCGGWWISTDEAYMAVTEDGGVTWQETTPDDFNEIRSISFISADTGWACGYGNQVVKTTDGGYNWFETDSLYGSKDDILFTDQMHGYMCSGSTFYYTIDGGQNWSTTYISNSSALQQLAMVDNVGYTVGQHGSMFKSEDAGLTWERTGSPPIPIIEKVYFSDSLNGWGLLNNNKYLGRSTDGGINWEMTDIGATMYLADFCFVDDLTGFAVEMYGDLYKTTDGGSTWNSMSINVSGTYRSLFFVNEQTGFLGGSDGLYLKTTDGGESWNNLNLFNYGDYVKTQFLDEQYGWVINNSGTVFMTENGGNSWSLKTFNGTGHLIDMILINENKGFVLRANGDLYATEDGGETWETAMTIPSASYFSRLDFANEEEGWLFSGARLYSTHDGGYSWSLHDHYSTMRSIYFLDHHHGWIYGFYGLMLSYKNLNTGLETMEHRTLMVYPNPASGKIRIELPENNNRPALLSVFDSDGKRILAHKIPAGNGPLDLNISDFENGLYLVDYQSGNKRNSTKFIKKN